VDEATFYGEVNITHVREPLPDWITYHNIAENMSCPPWELFEPEENIPNRAWWRETRIILDSARNEAHSQKQKMSKH
jgi:hypothetical protein